METILIIGVETVAGANIAASYSDRYRIIGVTSHEDIAIENCNILSLKHLDAQAISHFIAEVSPDRLILCGSMSDSHWINPEQFKPNLKELQQINTWAVAGKQAGCSITLISSDAVFTGPWMFHSEESHSFCATGKATFLRELERAVLASCPDTLVVRTNTFGWSPQAADVAIENVKSVCKALGIEQPMTTTSYATPILATDFAVILEEAHQANMTGVCHIAGGERTCQQTFISELAKEFGLPQLAFVPCEALEQRPTGFAAGETSLHSIRVRKELGLALPMLSESIAQLFTQSTDDYRKQFSKSAVTTTLRAA